MSDTSNIGVVHAGPLPNDAIHIAIAQVSAGEELKAGDRVGFRDNKEGVALKDGQHIGIVDPFLTETVKKDRLFYLFLFPNTVTSLIHQWEHPAFNRSPERIAEAEKWLERECAEYWDEDYPEATNHRRFIEEFKEGSVGYYAYGTDFSDKYNTDQDFRKKFWDNLEIVTGKTATKEQRQQDYFSCSC